MIDDPAPHPGSSTGPRPRSARPPDDEPLWGDPFASYATLSDPDRVPAGVRAEIDASDPWRPDRWSGGVDVDQDLQGVPEGPASRSGSGGDRRPLLLALLRPWFEPRPGELRGVIVLLAVSLAISLALWFDASRRPAWEDSATFAAQGRDTVFGAPGAPAGAVGSGPVGIGGVPGSVDGSDGWGLGPPASVPRGPVVHVSGAVRDPGIVTLPEGSRVADAVAASGGAMPDARLDRLNLARRVDDGERIHVPRVGEDAPPPDGPTSRGILPDGRIDLNAASQAELETLPGVGPARAQAIIAEREVRAFRVPGDLRRVPGIGEATFQRLAPLVGVR